MNEIATVQSKYEYFAELIERDIERKSLCAGMPYMTAADVGRMLNVHGCTANRALRYNANI